MREAWGEEVTRHIPFYSRECMEATKRPFVVQLFGTDLDNEAISAALVFKQSEVQTKEGQWYLTRIMPYRTAENVIDGLVLTFVDINPVKETQKTLRRMSKVFTVTLDPVLILDLAGRVIDLNEEAARHYGFSRDELRGQPVATIVPERSGGTHYPCLDAYRGIGMTMVLLKHLGGGKFTYAGAHESILIYRRATHQVDTLATDGTWLGLQDDIGAFLEEHEIELQPGDAMVLYTDGITEAKNPQGVQYNIDRLRDMLIRQGSLSMPSAQKIRDGIVDDVMEVAPGHVPVPRTIDATAEEAFRTYDMRLAPVQIYRGLFTPGTFNLVAPAKPVFVGFVDTAPVITPAEGGAARVNVSISSHTVELTRKNPDVRSHESQQRRAAGDDFYKDVNTVGDWEVPWGENRKIASGQDDAFGRRAGSFG